MLQVSYTAAAVRAGAPAATPRPAVGPVVVVVVVPVAGARSGSRPYAPPGTALVAPRSLLSTPFSALSMGPALKGLLVGLVSTLLRGRGNVTLNAERLLPHCWSQGVELHCHHSAAPSRSRNRIHARFS